MLEIKAKISQKQFDAIRIQHQHVGSGMFGDVYTDGVYAYKLNSETTLSKQYHRLSLQNKAADKGIAPRAYSIAYTAHPDYILEIHDFIPNAKALCDCETLPSKAQFDELKATLDELGFYHNDINTGNLLFDGEKLWLVDFDFSSFIPKKANREANVFERIRNLYSCD